MENSEDYCNILNTLNARVAETDVGDNAAELKNEIGFQDDHELYDHYKEIFGLKDIDEDSEVSEEAQKA